MNAKKIFDLFFRKLLASGPLVFGSLFLFHWLYIAKTSVNVPFIDEWLLFPGTSVSHLFLPHNEHLMVFTKLWHSFLYLFNGWNLAWLQIFNFLVYGIYVTYLISFTERHSNGVKRETVFWFAVFFLSPINDMNHYLPVQTVVHLSMIFLFYVCDKSFSGSLKWRRTLTLAALLFLCSISFASTITWAIALPLILIAHYFDKQIPEQSKPAATKLVFLLLVAIVISLVYSSHYQQPSHHPAMVLPTDSRFWSLFVNLVSFGFGVTIKSLALSTLFAIGLALVLIIWFFKSAHSSQRSSRNSWWPVFMATGFVLATLASVAAGRAGFSSDFSKVSRYAEFAMPLILVPIIAFSWILPERLKHRGLAALWVLYFLLFSNDWNFRAYDRLYRIKSICRDKIVKFTENAFSGEDTFNECYGEPLSSFIIEADNKKLSFMKEVHSFIQDKQRVYEDTK